MTSPHTTDDEETGSKRNVVLGKHSTNNLGKGEKKQEVLREFQNSKNYFKKNEKRKSKCLGVSG